MINEFKDFKLLLDLGFEVEEIATISFTSEERSFAYYKEFIDDLSTKISQHKNDVN